MNIIVASYALTDVLKALYLSNITNIVITEEDGNLVIMISEKELFSYNVCKCDREESVHE